MDLSRGEVDVASWEFPAPIFMRWGGEAEGRRGERLRVGGEEGGGRLRMGGEEEGGKVKGGRGGGRREG